MGLSRIKSGARCCVMAAGAAGVLVVFAAFGGRAWDGDASPVSERIRALADEAKPVEWVELPAACFQMGEDRAHREERPAHEACVHGFAIAAHEITNAQFAKFVSETNYVTRAELGSPAANGYPAIPPGSAVFVSGDVSRALAWWRFTPDASWWRPDGQTLLSASDAALPVTHVTYEDSTAFARWAGGRIPDEAEWEYAARGGLDGELYSWRRAEAAALNEKANTWQGLFPVLDTGDDGHAGVAPVGSYPGNGHGLFDMIGNVWEWTADPFFPRHDASNLLTAHPQGVDPAQPGAAVNVIKGGSYLCHRSYCYRYRPAARQAQDLVLSTSHIGFRIVRDVGM